jgi:poly(A) polymerase
MLEHPRFRAAYDFLLLREAAGEETDGLGQWWTQYQDANPDQRRQMIRELGDGSKSSAKRARSRPRRNKPRKPQSN